MHARMHRCYLPTYLPTYHARGGKTTTQAFRLYPPAKIQRSVDVSVARLLFHHFVGFEAEPNVRGGLSRRAKK